MGFKRHLIILFDAISWFKVDIQAMEILLEQIKHKANCLLVLNDRDTQVENTESICIHLYVHDKQC